MQGRTKGAVLFIGATFIFGLAATGRSALVAGFMYGTSIFAALLFVIIEYVRRNDRHEPTVEVAKPVVKPQNKEVHLIRNVQSNPLRKRKKRGKR